MADGAGHESRPGPTRSASAERPVAGDPQLGVFETLLAHDGRLQALGAHLGRLARSASELYGATLPPGLSG